MDRRALKVQLLRERSFCDVCGHRIAPDCDMHESIVPRRIAQGWPREKRGLIYHPCNCHLVCHGDCHTWAHAHPREMVAIQISRYGFEVVQEWIDSLEFRVPFSWHRGLDQEEANRMAEMRRRP